MIIKIIRTSLILSIIIVFLCSSSNVFAVSSSAIAGSYIPFKEVQFIGDHLKMTSPTTGTFQYKCIGENGADITDKFSAGQIEAKADVFINSNGASQSAPVSVDPLTGTCTVTYDFTDSCKQVRVDLTVGLSTAEQNFYIGDSAPEDSKSMDAMSFVSDSLTDTGENTAAFQYKALNGVGVDITKVVPASQIDAFSAIYPTTSSSSTIYLPVTLDPSQGIGAIKFSTPWNDKIIDTTLVDKSTGKNITLNTLGLGESRTTKQAASEVHRIDFLSSSLIKTGPDTAKFNYKIRDHYFSNITSTIPETDIDAYAVIGPSKVKVTLDPSTGEGTVNYNFSDMDKDVLVTLTYKTGVTVSAKFNIVNSESENTEDKNIKDISTAQIVFMTTGTSLYYHILNKYGKDITESIPFSQIAASSSVNSTISLSDPSMGKMGTWKQFGIDYNIYDCDRTVIITLQDKLSGVKTSLNIGNPPKEASEETVTDGKTDNEVVAFKDAALEKTVRDLIHRSKGDILESDVKGITSLSVDKGCTDLSGVEYLTGLKLLQLYSDKINSLEPLRKLSSLQTFEYYTDSMADLEPLKELKNLVNLEIGSTQVTAKDIQSLEKLTNLKFLDVHNMRISSEDLDSLKKALPNCYIFN